MDQIMGELVRQVAGDALAPLIRAGYVYRNDEDNVRRPRQQIKLFLLLPKGRRGSRKTRRHSAPHPQPRDGSPRVDAVSVHLSLDSLN
jgi:hypothetical protein